MYYRKMSKHLVDAQGRTWVLTLDLSKNYTITVVCGDLIAHSADKQQAFAILRENDANMAGDLIAEIALPSVVVPPGIRSGMREAVRSWIRANYRPLSAFANSGVSDEQLIIETGTRGSS